MSIFIYLYAVLTTRRRSQIQSIVATMRSPMADGNLGENSPGVWRTFGPVASSAAIRDTWSARPMGHLTGRRIVDRRCDVIALLTTGRVA